jgi:uncharacterized protein YjbJ (UPF0337 family)
MTDKNIDQAKGRVKEAAGALSGDRGLKNEGHADQAKGSLKKAVDRVAETVKEHNRSKRARVAMHAPSRSSVGR